MKKIIGSIMLIGLFCVLFSFAAHISGDPWWVGIAGLGVLFIISAWIIAAIKLMTDD